ncbi:MAG: gaf domain protein [Chitinophagaceae bacterium]|nr:gaf domain protein [Chitinophagaceae bacterium]
MLIRYKNILHLAGLGGFLLGIALTIICWTDRSGNMIRNFGKHQEVLIAASYLFGLIATLSTYIQAKKVVGRQQMGAEATESRTEEDQEVIDYSSIVSKMDKVYQSDEANNIKSDKILRVLCNGLNASQGALYKYLNQDKKPRLALHSSYAFIPHEETGSYEFETTDGMVGLAVKEDRKVELNDIPKSNFKVFSGLGQSANTSVVIIPVKAGEEMAGAIELCFFSKQDKGIQKFIHDHMSKIASLLY